MSGECFAPRYNLIRSSTSGIIILTCNINKVFQDRGSLGTYVLDDSASCQFSLFINSQDRKSYQFDACTCAQLLKLSTQSSTMAISATKLFKLQYLTLYAAIEAFLVAKFLPQWVPEKNALAQAFLPLLLLNYTLHTLFWGLLYPYCFSPLRNIPQPKVSLYNRFSNRRSVIYKQTVPKRPPLLLPLHGRKSSRPTLPRMGTHDTE